MSKIVAPFVSAVLLAGEIMLLPAALYKVFFALFKKWKTALAAIAILIFAFIYSEIKSDEVPLIFIAFAITGAIDVKAEWILSSGIGGNAVMVIYNIFISLFGEGYFYVSEYQDRRYFFLGENTFYLSRINNCSSTDLAAHYFWMMASYLWIRGKKITWGEIFALGGLTSLVYVLSASNTSLVCMGLILVFAALLKILPAFSKMTENNKAIEGLNKAGSFCSKISFLIIAFFCILLTVLFDSSNPIFYKLNNMFHCRLGLGHRGFCESGVSLIARDVPNYGMATSADGFFNFLDCSFVSILITGGILIFIFYMGAMTLIQFRHGKYAFGTLLLTVCALSCIEEHHLAELTYNMFILLLFADLSYESKCTVVQKEPLKKKTVLNIASFVLCAVFLAVSVILVMPKIRTVKSLDMLDLKSEQIYEAVQENLDVIYSDDSLKQQIDSMASIQYGDVLSHPDDYESKTGKRWDKAVSNLKEHSYYSVAYDGKNGSSCLITELIISNRAKDLIGNGSVVIEYDVSAGEVYAVWYSDNEGCIAIKNGRNSGRIGRLSEGVPEEGYFAGVRHG